MNTTTRTTLVALTLTGGLLLTACSGTTEPADTPTTGATAVVETTAPAETPSPEPVETGPVADEYSQVIDGVLYQGTEIAPVRIGTDTPGQPPALEANFPRDEQWKDRATDADKYVVAVGQDLDGGWLWKVHGMSRHGSFRELDDNGYKSGIYLPSREAAAAGPFTVDGRVLDRAEYVLIVN